MDGGGERDSVVGGRSDGGCASEVMVGSVGFAEGMGGASATVFRRTLGDGLAGTMRGWDQFCGRGGSVSLSVRVGLLLMPGWRGKWAGLVGSLAVVGSEVGCWDWRWDRGNRRGRQASA
jgi:hypothetical protein